MDLPGNQTVVFVTVTYGPPDRNGESEQILVDAPVDGCLFRPLRITEKQGVAELSTDVWQCIAPPVDAAVNAAASGQLKFNGVAYQVTGGAQSEYDMDGVPSHVTVLCQRQS